MSGVKALLISLSLLAIIGCQKKDEVPVAEKKQAAVNQKLSINELVNQANIGNQVSFIEKQFSLTPKSKSEDGTTYEVEGCEVKLVADNKGNAVVISAYVTTQKCSFETGFGNSKELTIEKLMEADKKNNWISRTLVNCVSSCGHTREPEYLYLSPGASVNGYIDTALISTSVKGTDVWLEKVKSILKLDNLDDDETINCTDKFDKLAMEHLKGGAISSVVISATNSIYWNEYPTVCKK
jgi:hypothetical protein